MENYNIKGDNFILLKETDSSSRFNYSSPNSFWNVLKRLAYTLFLAIVVAIAKFCCIGNVGIRTQSYTHTGVSNVGTTIPYKIPAHSHIINIEQKHRFDFPTFEKKTKMHPELQRIHKETKKIPSTFSEYKKSRETFNRLSLIHSIRTMKPEISAEQQLDNIPADATHAEEVISDPLPVNETETETDLIE